MEASSSSNRKQAEVSAPSQMKKECLCFTVSLEKGFRYIKSFFVGKAKRLTARNEEAAAQADLVTAKMQVEATDAAEDAKNRLNKSQ